MLELNNYVYNLHHNEQNMTVAGLYNGMRNGTACTYLDNVLASCITQWRNGSQYGIEFTYCEDLSGYITQWLDGRQHGIECWFDFGGVTSGIRNRRSGKQHGIDIDYDYRGKIEQIIYWRYGARHGTEIKYYPDGSIRWLKQQRDGISHGHEIEYHLDGSIRWLKQWRDGKIYYMSIISMSDDELIEFIS